MLEKFGWKFNLNNYPQKSQIYRWAHKYQAKASIYSLNKKVKDTRSGKMFWKCGYGERVCRKESEKTFWRRSQELAISRASLKRILKKNLQLYPYRIQIKHILTPSDMEFLVTVIIHYHSNGFHLFCNIWFWDMRLFSRFLYLQIISINYIIYKIYVILR